MDSFEKMGCFTYTGGFFACFGFVQLDELAELNWKQRSIKSFSMSSTCSYTCSAMIMVSCSNGLEFKLKIFLLQKILPV